MEMLHLLRFGGYGIALWSISDLTARIIVSYAWERHRPFDSFATELSVRMTPGALIREPGKVLASAAT